MATNYPDFQSALRSQMHESATVSTQAPPPPASNFQGLVISVAIAIGAVVVLRVVIRKLAGLKSDRRADAAKVKSGAQAGISEANDKAGSGSPPSAVEAAKPTGQTDATANEKVPTEVQETIGKMVVPLESKWSPVEKFIEIAPERIEEIRKLFSEVGRMLDSGSRQKTLEELCGRIRALRLICDAPELQAVDKLVANLEELFNQARRKSSRLSPSVLRTSAGAIVLLESLCKPGLQFGWIFDPPPKFLAVDDDPICRRAVASSLKKAFNEPDVAEQGQIALTLAAGKPYDVVFLDVEMPGMDGFEVCTKIHQMETNASTPVVFVTSHSDFDSRAKSAEAGGHDLIGKPFAPLEITVKALTLLIKRRLQGSAKQRTPAKSTAAAKQPQPATERPTTAAKTDNKSNGTPAAAQVTPAPAAAQNSRPAVTPASPPAQPIASPPEKKPAAQQPVAAPQPPSSSATPPTANGEESALALMAHVPKELSRLRSQLVAAGEAADANAMGEILGEFYVGIHSLTGEAELADLRAVFHLSWGVEKLIRKLLEKPNDSASAILHTAAAALDLMEELCRRQARCDPRHPPISILVVDDDPIALRTMSNALQLGFGRPDCAESGEAAIKTASEKAYDVIFLDVLMPGMDGFTTCPKIRETGLNSVTPVIFVTGLSDASAREKSERAGGNGFIAKPVIPVEIALTALTWALRARLDKGQGKPAHAMAEAAVA